MPPVWPLQRHPMVEGVRMEAETPSDGSFQAGRATLGALLDAIECASSGRKRAGADLDLQALRRELMRHIDGEAWLGGALGLRSTDLAHLYESAAALRRRMLDLRDALGADDSLAALSCVADLREMIASHLELERRVAETIDRQGAGGLTAGTPG